MPKTLLVVATLLPASTIATAAASCSSDQVHVRFLRLHRGMGVPKLSTGGANCLARSCGPSLLGLLVGTLLLALAIAPCAASSLIIWNSLPPAAPPSLLATHWTLVCWPWNLGAGGPLVGRKPTPLLGCHLLWKPAAVASLAAGR